MKKYLLASALIALSLSASADEGMWLVNMLDKAIEKNMKAIGLKSGAKVIYDEDNVSLSDAIVSLSFSCTGSMISDEGLMITNHHCAYADIFANSTMEHNYLEDGFWANRRNEELPIKGQAVQFLRKMIDVTAEAKAMLCEGVSSSKPMAFRKLSYNLEKRYKKMFPDNEVSLYSMYGGEKYYMAIYDEYKDVRLVAAPPVCIGAFGGDIDNWDWPQHKGDFAIYRIYTSPDGKCAEYAKENVPLRPRRTLKICTDGLSEGDFTMIMGYPGITNRYSSSYEVDMMAGRILPINATMQKERMEIMRKWMNEDPQIRLKYSDRFFMLSNVQEIRQCEAECLRRDKVVETLSEGREKLLPQGLLDSLMTAYELAAPLKEQTTYFQEGSVRSGNLFKLGILASAKDRSPKRISRHLETIDLRLEKEIFLLNINEIYAFVQSRFWGRDLTSFYEKYGAENVGEEIWKASALSGEHPETIREDDPVVLALNSMKITDINKAKEEAMGAYSLPVLNRRYEAELYRYCIAKGLPCYPDANSSMRLTYGKVCDLHPADGIVRLSNSTTKGILEKYKPENYEFSLKKDLVDLYNKGDFEKWIDKDGTMHVNFLTNNDITGGNSGSPVMNSKGELVGLAFDGNQEGLSGDYWYNPDLNRCVCVDIRYVLWVLDKYAHMNGLLDELFSSNR